MNPSNHHGKKSRKHGGNAPRHSLGHHKDQKQKQQLQIDKLKRHQDALDLSKELRNLSSQKRLKECIDLYRAPAHDDLRDAHHGSIVVDCCARCGDVDQAEGVVMEMLQPREDSRKDEITRPYFWEESKHVSYKRVPIQAWTALLKGYVHSGMMAKADSLFHYLCTTHSSIAAAGGGGSGKGKRKRDGAVNGPNVRTLNTLLRGCMWTATSLNDDVNSANDKNADGKSGDRNELIGGVATAGRAWSLSDRHISFDSSSYEYFITILAQSLQCKRAEDCLQKMKDEFGIHGQNNLEEVDPTLLESMVVCLVVIARGYLLLGRMNDGRRCAEEALRCIDAVSAANSSSPSPGATPAKKKQTTGGKKAWRDDKGSANPRDDGNPNERREESNKLFRSHRLSELRSEAQNLCLQCSCPSTKQDTHDQNKAVPNGSHVAHMMLTRLLYFSGGGTTGKDATKSIPDVATEKSEEDILKTHSQWIHSLWHSFGLKETVHHLLSNKDSDSDALRAIFQSSSLKEQSKKRKHQVLLPSMLSTQLFNSLRANLAGEESVIKSDGLIDFAQVFKSLQGDINQGDELHIELGAGAGDWAALQAELNPGGNYVTVELRSDRVAQTFAKCMLPNHQAEGQSKNAPLTNLCCVGSECGSFLRDRVEPGTVTTIFVNHPEPPTQTYSVSPGGDRNNAEEPAHMLNSQTIISAAQCLKTDGKGRLVVVTDNLIYARLICHSLVGILEEHSQLVGLSPHEIRDLRRIESFGHSSIHLYEGKPSSQVGHHIPHSKSMGGTSYFDRLWRTGAGKHADMRKRFIIALRTSGGNIDRGGSGAKSRGPALPKSAVEGKKTNKKKAAVEGNKTNKKRSDEKQRRRNERRLLKKQQMGQTETN